MADLTGLTTGGAPTRWSGICSGEPGRQVRQSED
jgi:hypothetical protein